MDIVWSDEALADLIAIETALSARFSVKRTLEIVDGLLQRIELLREQPRLGRVVPEFGLDRLRELVDDWNRIVYQLDVTGIEIIKIAPARAPLEPIDPIE